MKSRILLQHYLDERHICVDHPFTNRGRRDWRCAVLSQHAPYHAVVHGELSRDCADWPSIYEVMTKNVVFDLRVDFLHCSPPRWWRPWCSRSTAESKAPQCETFCADQWSAWAAADAAGAHAIRRAGVDPRRRV